MNYRANPNLPNDTEADPELEQFAYRFFETNGAALEKMPNGFEALLPEKLCRHLDVPEFINIGGPVNALSIGEIDKNPEDMPKRAFTMGVGTILDAKRIVMLVTGAEKADVLAKAVEGPVTSMISASALQLHSRVVVIVDEEAATKLEGKDYYNWIFQNEPEWEPYRSM